MVKFCHQILPSNSAKDLHQGRSDFPAGRKRLSSTSSIVDLWLLIAVALVNCRRCFLHPDRGTGVSPPAPFGPLRLLQYIQLASHPLSTSMYIYTYIVHINADNLF